MSMGPPLAARIREAILSGEFVPTQRLVEADLSERFAAGRAAVRAALLELAGEGLVERTPNRGARVRAVSLAEAIEICEVRMVIEGLCAAKAAERITDAEGEELAGIGESMRAAVSTGDVFGYSRLNERLHRRVREISGQRTAGAVLERLRGQSVRHQFRLAMRPGRPSVSLPNTWRSSPRYGPTTAPPPNPPPAPTCAASSMRWGTRSPVDEAGRRRVDP